MTAHLTRAEAERRIAEIEASTHRDWIISAARWPEPWVATGPNYDASYEGPEDGWVGSSCIVYAATHAEIIAEIDIWIEEHAE